MSDLLPCPFCRAPLDRQGKLVMHEPSDCVLSGEVWSASSRWVAAWNRRALPAVQPDAGVESIADAADLWLDGKL